jgi:hypothetical protein
MDLQDFSNESTPNADDFDRQPGMELDADGNFLGQEEEELVDEQFALAMDPATCPANVEPIAAREAPPNNQKGRQVVGSSMRVHAQSLTHSQRHLLLPLRCKPLPRLSSLPTTSAASNT